MSMLRAPSDNSLMLEKINNADMSHLFQKPKQMQASHISINSNLDIQYSPPKQKIKDQLDSVDVELKALTNKNQHKFKRWEKYAPYSFFKLSHEQKDNIFQMLYEDFITMKSQHNEYVAKYKSLYAQLHKCQNQISIFKRKGDLSMAKKIQIHQDQNKQNKQLKEEIQRLHQKIMALTSGKPVNKPKLTNNKTFSNTQKAIFPANQNLKAELELQKKHVRQLLEIIDDLRKNKLRLQAQFKGNNFDKGLSNINLKGGQRPGKAKNTGSQSQFKDYADQLLMWKQKHHELQLCYSKMNQDKDRHIHDLSKQLVDIKESERMKKNLERNNNRTNFMNLGNEDEINDLRQANQRLQTELKQLIRNPLFQDNNNTLAIQNKNRELEDELRKIKLQIPTIKQEATKYLSELELKTKQSADFKGQAERLKRQLKQFMQKDIVKEGGKNGVFKYDQNDYYRKLLQLVKLQGDDPVWKKYSDMQSPIFTTMTESKLKEVAQSLWKNKLQLLAHLEKAKIQLKTNKQTQDNKINFYSNQKERLQEELRIATARLDQWQSMDRVRGVKREFQLFQYKGLKYNDSISVFEDAEDEIKALDHNQNFFDLYLGQLNLDETNVLRHPQNKIKSISSLISFLTVDFYNHPTQHSNFSEGLSKKLLNNYSYKVQVNSYFIKFLNKNAISIELWSPQGTSTVLFGKGQIWLNQLLNSTSKQVSNVVKGKCPIYSPNKALIATIEYRMRTRLPISPFLQWANNKQSMNKHSKIEMFSVNQRKKLAITIEKAEGLFSGGNTFVYFNIQNEDFFTEPQMGSSPFWDYHREVDVILDEDFSAYLKQNFIQFTLFDDDKQVNEDVVGIAKANLTPLLQSNSPLDLVLQIQDSSFQKIGKLKIKAYWA